MKPARDAVKKMTVSMINMPTNQNDFDEAYSCDIEGTPARYGNDSTTANARSFGLE